MTPLIDATEMYLRTIWELEEEGITPIRARLVDRLGLSAPAVSETVARLEHDGLVRIAEDRTLDLTDVGRELAVSVMRKHRLAERLLTDVIGLEWEQVHAEACKWEHVISDAVEARLIELLHDPDVCPHGNPIPGVKPAKRPTDLMSMREAAKQGGDAVLRRISEKLQGDIASMRMLREHNLRPGAAVTVSTRDGEIVVDVDGDEVVLDRECAANLYVSTT